MTTRYSAGVIIRDTETDKLAIWEFEDREKALQKVNIWKESNKRCKNPECRTFQIVDLRI